MSNYNWCHGPNCHTYHTLDRVRGVKGSKVLRTRKIKLHNMRDTLSWWQFFCSQGCYDNFANKYIEQVIAIAPRTECLETPIKDPTKEVHNTDWGSVWTNTKIEVDETRQS